MLAISLSVPVDHDIDLRWRTLVQDRTNEIRLGQQVPLLPLQDVLKLLLNGSKDSLKKEQVHINFAEVAVGIDQFDNALILDDLWLKRKVLVCGLLTGSRCKFTIDDQNLTLCCSRTRSNRKI